MKRLISTVLFPLSLVCLIVVLGLYQPALPSSPKQCCPGGKCQPAKPCCPDGKCQPVKVKPFVVAFGATWCVPCQQAQPALKRIEEAGFEVTHIDIDRQPELAKRYGVTSVPTFFIRANGEEVQTQDIQVVLAAFGLSKR